MGKSVTAEVDDAVLASLVERATRNGRSLEEEAGAILAAAVRPERAALVEELRREQGELAAKYGVLSDSTPLIREWRDQ